MIYTKKNTDGLTVNNTVTENGLLTASYPEDPSATFTWFKSKDQQTWEEVTRSKVAGSMYNLTEDHKSVNVAVDQGEQTYYKVEVLGSNNEQLAESQPIFMNFYTEISSEKANGSFEYPIITEHQDQIPNGYSGFVWKTTGMGTGDKAGHDIEVLNTRKNTVLADTHNITEAKDGYQFVEINCENFGALYQDVLTIPGSTLYWEYWHASRLLGQKTDQTDTAALYIAPTSEVEKMDISFNDLSSIKTYKVSSHKNSEVSLWEKVNGEYTVPEGQYVTRFFFVSEAVGNTQNNKETIGNFIDNVHFGFKLPPKDPDHGSLVVTKTISGDLSKADFEKAAHKFELKDANGKVVESFSLPKTSVSENPLDEWNQSFNNLDPGEYTLTETPATKTGYDCTTTYRYGLSAESKNGVTARFTIVENQSTWIVFDNKYTAQPVSFTLSHTVSGNMADRNKDFEFHIKLTDKQGKPITEPIKDNQGTEILSYDEKAGYHVVKLKHDEKIAFSLPYGSNVVVEQKPESDYTTTHGDDKDHLTQTDYQHEVTLINGNGHTHHFNNDKNGVVPAGLDNHDKNIEAAMLVAGSAVLLFAVIMGARRRMNVQ